MKILIISQLCFLLLPLFIFAQISVEKVIGDKKYIKKDGIWHTTFNQALGSKIDTSRIVVKMKKGYTFDDIDVTILGLPKLINIRGKFLDNFYELSVPKNINTFTVIEKLSSYDLFENVHFNLIAEIAALPDDYYYEDVFKHWNLQKINMPASWDITTGSSDIIVAIVDNGVQYDHPDLSYNKWSGIGYDYYSMDSNPYPENISIDGSNYHGTAVTGIICSRLNNEIGTSGMAGGWNYLRGVSFMSLRAGLNRGISISAAAQAIEYAVSHGANVINCSFTIAGASQEEYQDFESAINTAVSNDVLMVCASGYYISNNQTDVKYPASNINTLAVGATTETDERKKLNDGTGEEWGSCYGPELDVVAPGIHIPTTDYEGVYGKSTTDYYLSFNGTSAAAPHVTALAGLIYSLNAGLSYTDVKNLIKDNAVYLGYPLEYGSGRIDALATLNATPIPLSIDLSGPSYRQINQSGTYTAIPSGGSNTYINYQWWERNDESGGGINPRPIPNQGDNLIDAPPQGEWIYQSGWEGQQTIQVARSYDFSLKCEVTDSDNNTATDIHSIIVGGDLAKAQSDNSDKIEIVVVPDQVELSGNYPNPFNPSTTIRFGLPEDGNVKITIYSINGQEIIRLANGYFSKGYHEIRWNGKNPSGRLVANGLYITELKTGNKRLIKKMVFAK